MPNTTSLREKHFPALDGLRGLAALMVVAHHSPWTFFLSSTFDKAYLRFTSLLWVGVDLFFVLSGFLITNILLDTRKSPNYFRAFYGRRIVRIFPLYYTFLATLYFLLPSLGVSLTSNLVHAELWQWTYMPNIYDGFFPWPNMNINHFWTLGIEEQFYLVWPLVVFLMNERYQSRNVIIVFLVLPFLRAFCLLLGFSFNFIYTFTLCHIDGLLLGALIAIGYRRGLLEKLSLGRISISMRRFDWMLVGFAFVFIVVYCLFLRNDQFVFNVLTWSPAVQCVGITIISLPLAYTVMRAISPVGNKLQHIMSLKYLRLVGKYSYALYVLHAPICIWVGGHFPVPNFLQNLPLGWTFVHSLYIIIAQFALSIAAAVLSWNILEKHFLKLKRYFPYEKPAIGMEPNELLAVQGEVG